MALVKACLNLLKKPFIARASIKIPDWGVVSHATNKLKLAKRALARGPIARARGSTYDSMEELVSHPLDPITLPCIIVPCELARRVPLLLIGLMSCVGFDVDQAYRALGVLIATTAAAATAQASMQSVMGAESKDRSESPVKLAFTQCQLPLAEMLAAMSSEEKKQNKDSGATPILFKALVRKYNSSNVRRCLGAELGCTEEELLSQEEQPITREKLFTWE
jgi:hypothetical protein